MSRNTNLSDLFTNPDQGPEYFADVILPLPLPRPYTYAVPNELVNQLTTGCRVIVQFGNKRIVTALVINIHTTAPDVYEAKPILELLDDEPSVNAQQLQLYQWIADYYMCHPGEVMNAALPSGLKVTSESKIQLNPDFNNEEMDFSDKEFLLIEALKANDIIGYSDVTKVLGQKTVYPVIKSLLAKGRIIVFEEVREKYSPKIVKKVRLSPNYLGKDRLEELFEILEKKPKQVDVLLKYLQQIPVFDNATLNEKGIVKSELANTVSASAINTLVKNGILEEYDQVISRFPNYQSEESTILLSEEQNRAKNEIHELMKTHEAVLLHGVTGSGKTEVFITLIQEALAGGTQVLYLLPEIGLTTQIVNRLRKVFGQKMGVYHSKFSDNERVEVWKQLLSGEVSFIIGVRSSVFLPFDNLGLIIVDEEHEASYKQYDPAPRYHARDTALVLARIHHAKTLLGSATPSVESYYNTQSGKWGLVQMKKRFGEAQLPDIHLINTREEKKHKRLKNEFSDFLLNEIQLCLDKKQQVILFQNRRGYSPYLECEDCGHIIKCNNCAVSLTYHMYKEELRCHYCGHIEKIPSNCAACGSEKIKTIGFGTEKLEDEIKIFFPNAAVERMDLDTTRKKDSYQKILQDFEERNTDILIGTQMVSKGLDFNHVQLVAVFDSDRMINFPDFRSHERAFQTIMQVSGRAGRRLEKGKVVIQTHDPEQRLFTQIIKHDYLGMYNDEIKEREKYHYPPFVRIIKLTIKHTDKYTCARTSHQLKDKLQFALKGQRVLGPEYALIEKLRNHYQMEIIIKLDKGKVNMKAVREIISNSVREILVTKDFRNAFVVIDCDPV